MALVGPSPVGVPVFLDAEHVYRMEVLPVSIDPAGHYVYVAWASDDPEEVLYVGMTSRIHLRLAQHFSSSPWVGDAGHIDVYGFEDRAAAAIGERDLILHLMPTHNVQIPLPVGRGGA